MPRCTSPYTKELLEEILKEGSATLVKEYDKFNQRMQIEFICKCGEKSNKKFEMLNVHRLPYCKECSKKEHAKRGERTCLEKYGVKNGGMLEESIEKTKKHFIEKYGDHPKRTKEVQEKYIKTCLEKYGGHPNQNAEVQAKSEASAFNYRNYLTPSGEIRRIQGYEYLALDELFEKGYSEDDVITGKANVPKIHYKIDEINHVYFPDIHIPSENRLIEVKSDWSIQKERANVKEKAEATVKIGYTYEIWIYDSKQIKMIEIPYNDYC